MELLENRASTKAKIQHYDTTKEQIASRKTVLAETIQELAEEGRKQGQNLKEYEEQLETVRKEIETYNSRIAENEQEISRLQKDLSEKQEKLRIGQTAFHRESSRLESLKNITERYDGYGNSIRKVMANKTGKKV